MERGRAGQSAIEDRSIDTIERRGSTMPGKRRKIAS